MASQASLILADEPIGNLDEKNAAQIAAISQNCAHAQGKCVIIASHSAEMAEMADVVLELKKGHVVER